MRHHIVLSKPFDLEQFSEGARQGINPRHVLADLSQKLDATIHKTGNHPITFLDRVFAKFFGTLPEQWAMARSIVPQLSNEDIVFCNGTDVGFPLAMLCKVAGKRPKLATHVMVPENRRVRLLLKLFALDTHIDAFQVYNQSQGDFLQSFLNLSSDRVSVFALHTDTDFFSPGATSPSKSRPIIASAGLEQRDYVTLAEATHDLDVDVKICAASCAAKAAGAGGFPKVIPANMEARYYDFAELRQLYRDADIVVVPVVNHTYSAGSTVVLEAMACCKPVVLTSTPGRNTALRDEGVVRGVPVGDAASLRAAIVSLLNNPQEAAALAQRGHEKVLRENATEKHLQSLISLLTAMETESSGDRAVTAEA
ncbi:glycosyltransferase family 4 protein [Leptolyngbya sp. GGD]|uniref:glycosyltransferase family 4 protein n=1 Tax=Leptolyngbya sp. GGD TaxID=2997907 RepID=UPI00227CF087|nr:glycosyltransferase family 4 protein [Leptolyngbya sp. GGD]MCY6490457.1 glycosyltransferase family 4 protein [Leptolyngbya sp. GGD]